MLRLKLIHVSRRGPGESAYRMGVWLELDKTDTTAAGFDITGYDNHLVAVSI